VPGEGGTSGRGGSFLSGRLILSHFCVIFIFSLRQIIQFLQEDLGSLLADPNVTLKNLMEIRDTMEDIQNLRESVEQDRETS